MKRYLTLLCSGAITGILLYSIFSETGLEQFAEILANTDKSGLFAYIAISLTALLARTARYRIVIEHSLGKNNSPNFSAMLITTSIRNALVDFLPARLGEASYFYIASRYGVPLNSATTSFAICFVLDIIVLFFMFSLLGLESAFDSSMLELWGSSTQVLTIAGGVALLAGILLLVLFNLGYFVSLGLSLFNLLLPKASADSRPSRFSKLINFGLNFLTQIRQELDSCRSPTLYLKLVLLTFVLRFAKYGGLYVLLIAVIKQFNVDHSQISPLLTSVAFISAEASASLPISGIMGFGAYEGAWSLIFSLSKVEIPSTKTLIFAVHLITQMVGYSVAALALAFFLGRELRLLRKTGD